MNRKDGVKFEVELDGNLTTVEIMNVYGAGSRMYHVLISGYYKLRFWKVNDKWQFDTPPKSTLTKDDIDILMDMVIDHG